MGFIKKLTDWLVPVGNQPVSERADSKTLTRQDILDYLEVHFNQEMDFETTKFSLLFHTSYVVYLRQHDYLRLAPSFGQTVMDAVNMFLDAVSGKLRKYPGYRPHSRFWTFQLVCIPDGTIIDGLPDDVLDEKSIVIKSSLYPDDMYVSGNSGRVVTTFHSVNSMRAMPGAVNSAAFRGLDQLDKDKYQVRFDPENRLRLKSDGGRDELAPVARLTAEEGSFITNGITFSTYQMAGDSLRVSGRNEAGKRGRSDTLCVDDENVMNPHLLIRRDPVSGTFSISAIGDVRLNERRLLPGNSQWLMLPNNSKIIINDDIQIGFKIL